MAKTTQSFTVGPNVDGWFIPGLNYRYNILIYEASQAKVVDLKAHVTRQWLNDIYHDYATPVDQGR